jgi:hypothetical protein
MSIDEIIKKYHINSFSRREKYFSEEEQLEAVKISGYSIKFIKNPSEAVQLEAIKEKGDIYKKNYLGYYCVGCQLGNSLRKEGPNTFARVALQLGRRRG